MNETIEHLKKNLIKIISETNGLSLNHTLELLLAQSDTTESEKSIITDFLELVHLFHKSIAEFVIDRTLNENTRTTQANLTLVSETAHY